MRGVNIGSELVTHDERVAIFWSRVVEDGDCWVWVGPKTPDGYGQFAIGNHRQMRAHRLAYELMRVEIPDGLHIDHLCRNRACVNPDHLDPVTPTVNAQRGRPWLRDVCQNGHPRTEENTKRAVTSKGFPRIECLICHRAAYLRRPRKSRAKGATA